jgi:hypothetical protein
MKNKKIMSSLLLLGLSMTVLLSACSSATPTMNPEEIMTSIAETVAVDFTRTAIARPTDTPTPLPTPTNTATPFTPTIAVTNTPPGTQAPTSIPGGRDAGVWVSSNPADESNITAGEPFDVSVSLMNTGTSTWTTAYAIKFTNGERMGAPETIYLPIEVPPTKSITLTVSFTAPSTGGTVRSNWQIVNAAGTGFSTFYFEYNVVTP